MLFYPRRYAGGQLSVASLPTGICILHIMGFGRRSTCTQCPRSRTLADVPYICVRGQSCASVCMISNLASKYRSVLDGFENNKSSKKISTDKYNPVRSVPQTQINTSNATNVLNAVQNAESHQSVQVSLSSSSIDHISRFLISSSSLNIVSQL